MKNKLLILVAILLITATKSFTQNSKISSAEYLMKTDLEKAKIKIDEAISSPKTKNILKANFIKGEIYKMISISEDENIKNLEKNAEDIALQAYLKVVELDKENKYLINLSTNGINVLFSKFFQKGIDYYNANESEKAIDRFEKAYTSAENLDKKFIPNKDTLMFYPIQNLILLFSNSGNNEKVIEYGKKFMNINISEPSVFNMIAQAYIKAEKVDEGINLLKSGIEKYPENSTLFLNELINLYLTSNKNEEAKVYLEKAIEKDPNNKSYYFAIGVLYEKLENKEKALENYKKSLEIDSEYLEANFNIGALFVNKAIKQFDEANSVVDNKKHMELKKNAEKTLLEAKPYLEKCYEIKNDDPAILQALKDIYIRTEEQEKYDKIDKELKVLKGY